ncbi:hypothetical protein EDD18DRAFT_1383531 [Armillaria luteobubalina]|uniref:Uncharacterized protein n=1 Tax=Armillaria luteobubalina TaxID=153913 RepID=A0AA39P2Y9_9AGAR|nr:hypothetical protein EDD18DRAFT_1383531 [Armillaria luteobubalina]
MADLLSKLEWEPLPDGTPGRRRILSGGEIIEDIMNHFFKGYQTLFHCVSRRIHHSDQSNVTAGCREAWKWLRYNIPTIAIPVEVDKKDVPCFVYHAGTPELVEAWADRTCIIHRQDVVDLDALHELACGAKIPSADGDATWLHIAILKGTDSISKLSILLHTQHAPFDGTALKYIFNLYLAQLAKILSSDTYVPDVLPWGKEVDNLIPATMNVLAPHEPQPIPLSS